LAKFKAKHPNLETGLIERPTRGNATNGDQYATQAVAPTVDSSDSDYILDWSDNRDITTENLIDMDTSNEAVPIHTTKDQPKPPCKQDFLVPTNAQEHIQMTNQLILAGTSKIDADLIISSRKKAFYKANSDFKKSLNANARSDSKKTGKPSKPVAPNSSQNGI
jgi:hypothetical protein